MSRHTFRADVGPAVGTVISDQMREHAAREGSQSLLRAQLRAGQHLLALPLARSLAATIGLNANQVRPASGTTITTGDAK